MGILPNAPAARLKNAFRFWFEKTRIIALKTSDDIVIMRVNHAA